MRNVLLSLFIVCMLLGTSSLDAASLRPADTREVNLEDGLTIEVPDVFLPAAIARALERSPGPDAPWWERTTFDQDRDGISDPLEELASEDPDAELYLLVSLDGSPDERVVADIEAAGPAIEVVQIYNQFDLVEVWGATSGDLAGLAKVPGVVMLWKRGTRHAQSHIATPNMKARGSEEYSPDTAWEVGYLGRGVNIAIIDTGIDNEHPSLVGKWVGGVDVSKPATPWWPHDGSFDADDTNGHGTTCSGIATGTGAPEGKYMGSAPEARLVEIRIGTIIGYAPGEGPMPVKWMDSTLLGQQWSIDHKDDQWNGVPEENRGIDIASESWGIDVGGSSDGTDPYSQANDRMVEAGLFVFNAAGNDGPGNDGFTGMSASELAIIVAASDDIDTIDRSDDEIASYSSRGPRKDDGDDNQYDELIPHITAPGTRIDQVQFDRVGDGSGNGYGSRGSGTSYATPAAAGVGALMLEAGGNMTPAVMRDIMEHTAERRGNASMPELDPFWNRDWGYGLIDAYRAVTLVEWLGEDIVDIDPDLQGYITNVTVSNGRAIVEGIAWSETDRVEYVEVSIDNGTTWHRASDRANDTWAEWDASFDIMSLGRGNHTVVARAVRGNMHSTPDMAGFTKGTDAGAGAISVDMTVGLAIVAVIAVLVIIYLVRKGYIAGPRRPGNKDPGK